MVKLAGNGTTLAIIKQQLCDHILGQEKQFGEVDKRLDGIEGDVKKLVEEKGTWFTKALPTVFALLILTAGWIWSLSGQASAIESLTQGRFENKGNIATLTTQLQEVNISNARRDVRYEMIITKLEEIEKKLDRQLKNK
jgi:tetrahydromethanopterin S-methyltransferase subunit G